MMHFPTKISSNFLVGDNIIFGDAPENLHRNSEDSFAEKLASKKDNFFMNLSKSNDTLQSLIARFNSDVSNRLFLEKRHMLGLYNIDRVTDFRNVSNIGDKVFITSMLIEAANGDIIASANTHETGNSYESLYIWTSSDRGQTWIERKIINNLPIRVGAYSMITHGEITYLSVIKKGYESSPTIYRCDIYKSIDNGVEWTKLHSDLNYVVDFNKVYNAENTKCGITCYYAPYPAGYTQAWLNFGWFNFTNETIEEGERLATVGDEVGNFPSENTIYRRKSDNAIIACLRWGEHPQVPYHKNKISYNEGLTWTWFGEVWAGYAGMLRVVETQDNELWGCGYHIPPAGGVAYTELLLINPETSSIIKNWHPLGLDGYMLATANGSIICHSDGYLYAVQGYHTQKFFRIKQKLKYFNINDAVPILYIHIGINDINANRTEQQIKDDFLDLFQRIGLFDVKIISIPFQSGAKLELIQIINTWLEQQCTSNGYEFINYFDFGQENSDNENYYSDELVLTEAGINKLLNEVEF